jgi:CRP/FNR family transcriptional regulator
MGDRLEGIYLVNVGAIKLYRTTESGDQQILGFYTAGDLVGLDSLPDGVSQSEAVALDTSSATFVSHKSLLTGKRNIDQQDLLRLAGREINRENDLALMLSQRSAERRLAWFLVNFSDGLRDRKLAMDEFNLPMTRTDIALYLGLALETVCRELARFEDLGLIRKNRRRIIIQDLDKMRELATGVEQ